MEPVTGRDVMISMLSLANEIALWNKGNTSRCLIEEDLAKLRLTPQQMHLLGFLYSNRQANTVSALSAALHISKGSLSLMLSKLTGGGFVQKQAAKGDDDGRKVYISLTPKGYDAVEKIKDSIIRGGAGAFEEMDEERRKLLYHKLEEIRTIFHEGGLKI
ncbi:MAG: MarR family transcriptional regulator [Anaerotignum sp.]|nr:MarR family transcriptional regulator [Anaerotignum sp.]